MPASKTNPKVHGNKIGDIQKVAFKTLMDSGVKPETIAEENNVSVRTLFRIKADEELKELDSEKVSALKEGLQKLSYKRSYQALKSVDDDKFKKASLVQTAVASKIWLEMGRLSEGLSTENVSITQTDAELEGELESRYQELQRIKNAKPVIDITESSTQDPIPETIDTHDVMSANNPEIKP